MQKQPGWEARLVAYLGDVRHRDFDPSSHHCAFFAADAIKAMTGVDLAAPWRGLDLKAGLQALRAAGIRDHVALAEAQFEEVPVAFAQAGDLAVIPTPDGDAFGIVQGASIYVLRRQGLGLVSLLAASRMFRIP